MTHSSFIDLLNYVGNKYSNSTTLEIRRKIIKERIFYKDLKSLVFKTIAFFKKEETHEKDKIIFWGLNCPEYALALLSCFTSNRTAIPIDYRNTEETIKKIIGQTSPKVAFVSRYIKHDFLHPLVDKIFIIEDLTECIQPLSQAKEKASYRNPENISEIVYTSGTTGEPKGVTLLQKNLLSNTAALTKAIPKLPHYKTISILPLSHMYEQIVGFLSMLNVGSHIIYLPRINSFRILKEATLQNPTHLLFVPQLFSIFEEKLKQKVTESGELEKFELTIRIAKFLPMVLRKLIFRRIHQIFGKDFRFFGSGGAPLSLKTTLFWNSIGFTILEGYGATEVGAVATINTPEQIKYGSVGKEIEGVKVFFDEDSQIIIDSNSTALGYFKNLEKTKTVFNGSQYKTGDIGFKDKDGFLHIKGRDDFKIVLPSGEKVFSEDLEEKIKANKSISDACVLESGGSIFAYVTLTNSKGGDNLEDIFNEINKNLESKQQVRFFKKWPQEDFPRTFTLKIDRKKVIEFHKNANDKSILKTDSKTFKTALSVKDIISNISNKPVRSLKGSDVLSGNLKLDSLERVEIVSQLEEYLGVAINEGDITAETTVKDLEDLVEKSTGAKSDTLLSTWQFSRLGEFLHLISNKLVIFPLHKLIIKIKYSPQKEAQKIKTGSVIITNHPGTADILCTHRILSDMGINKTVTLATASAWEKKSKFRYFFELSIGALPTYETGQKFIDVLKVCSDLLDRGYVLIIAPQGRAQRRGIEDPFLPGIGFILKELKKPFYIVKIKGYREIWPAPKKNFLEAKISDYITPKKGGTVEVITSKEFFYETFEGLNNAETVKNIERTYK